MFANICILAQVNSLSMKEFFVKADRLIRNINENLERYCGIVLILIKSPLLYFFALILLLLLLIGIKILLYQDYDDIILYIALGFLSCILFIALGVHYYGINIKRKTLGLENFKESRSSLQNSSDEDLKDELLLKSEGYSQSVVRGRSLSGEHLEEIYKKICEFGALDYKNLENEIDDISIFSKEYFIGSLKKLNQANKTDSPLFFTANQKIVGAIIFDLIQPYLLVDSKTIAKHTYYLKSGKFVLVNYASIDAPKKRAILKNI